MQLSFILVGPPPLHAAMYQICHCEAVGRGNLQHRGMMTAAPINIEHFGFTMLIGWQLGGTALLEIPTGFALGMTDLVVCAYSRYDAPSLSLL